MDHGETGSQRPKGEVDLHGIDAACLVSASRIIDLQGIIGDCDDPAKPRGLIFVDVTALESDNKNRDPFLSITFQETALIGDQYCNQNKDEIEAISVKVTNPLFLYTRAGSGKVQKS